MDFEMILQECSLSDPLCELLKWFCSAEKKWPPELKIEKPLNDISHASGPISK